MLTLPFRTQETAHKAEIAGLMILMAVVDTHEHSSSPTHRLALVLNSLLHQLLVGKIHMPLMEATTTMWQCGMQQWLNSSNNRLQVSKPDHQVLDDRRALTRDAVTVTVVSPGAVMCMKCLFLM